VSYPIDSKLVIAIASSALFDLSEPDRVFREQGLASYRQYQREHEDDCLPPGVAFPLVRRLLSLNEISPSEALIEVVLVSRNDPDTGLRVFKSIQSSGLDISRAAFTGGKGPFRYLAAFNAALFLSANADDVRHAVMRGAPAGLVFPTDFVDDLADPEVRIAFDFDGIIADDSAESIFQSSGLQAFLAAETDAAAVPLPAGPLSRLFRELAALQRRDRECAAASPRKPARLRLAIVTARSAPAHERVVTTLRSWGIEVDEVFFLGGIEKARILEVFRPHIFFDDQLGHIDTAKHLVPAAHVPFGVANAGDLTSAAEEALAEAADRATNDGPA